MMHIFVIPLFFCLLFLICNVSGSLSSDTITPILVAICTKNRAGYVQLLADSLQLDPHMRTPFVHLLVRDDMSTEYNKTTLEMWFPNATIIVNDVSQKADTSTQLNIQFFVDSEYAFLLVLDSDALLNPHWYYFLVQNFMSLNVSVISLYNSNASHHVTTNCDSIFCEKSSVGALGLVMTKAFAQLMLPRNNGYGFASLSNSKVVTKIKGFDWGISQYCKENGIVLHVPRQSLILHYGIIGQNNDPSKKNAAVEKANDFDITSIPHYLAKCVQYWLTGKNPANRTGCLNDPINISGKDKQLPFINCLADSTGPDYSCFTILLPHNQFIQIPKVSKGLVLDGTILMSALSNETRLFDFKKNISSINSRGHIYLETLPVYSQTGALNWGKHHLGNNLELSIQHYSTIGIWWLPNLDFIDPTYLLDPRVVVSLIFAKTMHTVTEFVKFRSHFHLNYSILFTKFTSRDCLLPSVKKMDEVSFLHVAGNSPLKNTIFILNIWAAHPEWPHLTIITHRKNIVKVYKSLALNTSFLANTKLISAVLSFRELQTIQNQIQFHICISEAEGFGHYINEARSVGAIIITGNISPTNELVDSSSGILVGESYTNLVLWKRPDMESVKFSKHGLKPSILNVTRLQFESAIQQCREMNNATRQLMSITARQRYDEDRVFFLNTMNIFKKSVCHGDNQKMINKLLI